jgi:hypothetical protein
VRRLRDPATSVVLLVAAWLATRTAVLVLTRARGLYPYQDDPFEISVLAAWGAAFAGEPGVAVPLRDGPWEYPLGAVPVVLAPALLEGAPYVLGFVAQMVLWDAALLLLLALVGLRHGSLAGAWLWVVAVPLLGPVALARFDVVPTALAVAGLAGGPLLAGVLLASAALVKAWPALLLPLVLALRPGRARTLAGATAVGVAALAAAAAAGVLPQVLSPLRYQRDRGLEVESLPALPLLLARARGDERVTVGWGFGSYQVDGPWADTLLAVSTVGTVAVLLVTAALAWRVRRPEAVLPLAVLGVTGVLLFDKVLSAQYPLWIAGLVALALCRTASPLRATVPALLGALLLTQLVYPLAVQDLLAGDQAPLLVLLVRDLLLVVVALQAGAAAWGLRGSRSEHEVPVDVEQRQQAQTAG